MNNLKDSISELIIIGFNGKTLSNEIDSVFQQKKPTNFILFTDANYESKAQLIELTDAIQAKIKENGDSLPAMISADQEGGRVQRFRKDFTLIPAAMKLGTSPDQNLVKEIIKAQARELFHAGIQLNFAPVCDVNTNPANPVIGDRAYGVDEVQASQLVRTVIQAHQEEFVETCIKHFPGHGDTHVDSHESLPTVHTPLDTLRSREWLPFQAGVEARSNFLMSAHILLPHLDAKYPGTFSKTFLKTYLRGELQFNGIIISDDMQMGAVTLNYGKEEAPILALQAGCDLLCYRSLDESLLAIESIEKALRDGRLEEALLIRSIQKIRNVRKNLKLACKQFKTEHRLSQIGHPSHQSLVEHFLKRS